MNDKRIARFFTSHEAATSVEYAIMLGLIILVCFVAIKGFGVEAAETMTSNSTEIGNVMNP